MNTGTVNPNVSNVSPETNAPERAAKSASLTVSQKQPDKANGQQKIESVEQMKELREELNEQMDELQTNLEFSISEEHNDKVVVEIKNRETEELVKQIPPEEMLDIQEKMAELTGLLFDKSV